MSRHASGWLSRPGRGEWPSALGCAALECVHTPASTNSLWAFEGLPVSAAFQAASQGLSALRKLPVSHRQPKAERLSNHSCQGSQSILLSCCVAASRGLFFVAAGCWLTTLCVEVGALPSIQHAGCQVVELLYLKHAAWCYESIIYMLQSHTQVSLCWLHHKRGPA